MIGRTIHSLLLSILGAISSIFLFFPNASDELVVLDTPLFLAKSFAEDTVAAGGTVDVTFSCFV